MGCLSTVVRTVPYRRPGADQDWDDAELLARMQRKRAEPEPRLAATVGHTLDRHDLMTSASANASGDHLDGVKLSQG